MLHQCFISLTFIFNRRRAVLLVADPLPVPELRTCVEDAVESLVEEVGLDDTAETALNVGETGTDVLKNGTLNSENITGEIAGLIAELKGTATDDRTEEEGMVSLETTLEAEVLAMEN